MRNLTVPLIVLVAVIGLVGFAVLRWDHFVERAIGRLFILAAHSSQAVKAGDLPVEIAPADREIGMSRAETNSASDEAALAGQIVEGTSETQYVATAAGEVAARRRAEK